MAAIPVRQPSKQLLVIDDDPDIRLVVQSSLEEIAGWTVTTAISGKDGLIKLISEQPDAILLDMMMPEMDGVSFLKVLRGYMTEEKRNIPVLILTAKTAVNPVVYDLGVLGIMTKPFDPFLLPQQIANYLGWTLY